jgi:hypothetical protein
MALAETLQDNFNDNSFNSGLWELDTLTQSVSTGVTVNETNQRLEITPETSLTGSRYRGYRSVATYDLTGSYVLVEVPQVAGPGNTDTILAALVDASNFYRILKESSLLYFQDVVASTYTNVNIIYNATNHRWWRIRHVVSGDTIRFDTSPDGQAWTEQRSIARVLTITAMDIGVEAGTFESTASIVPAHFDNFNIAGGTLPTRRLGLAAPAVATSRNPNVRIF